jgi:hypothetical protein
VDPIALVAPGLLAIGAGVIGLRLAGLAMRAMLRPSRESYRVAWFLTVRELARRQPSALRQLLPTSVAVGLVVFAVCSWALATTNRSTLASFENGAARVVDVNVRPGVNLVDAVRAADPSGRSAMAAAVYRSQSGALLAVDASRLAAVATWPAGLTSRSATEVGHYLSPATLPPIEFVGGSLRATIVLPPGAPSIDLSATVFNETSQDQSTIDMGTLRPGTGSYIGSLQGFCASTCRLVNLSPTAPSASPGARSTVHMTVETLAIGSPGESWRNLPFGAGHPRSWSAVPAPAAVITRRATTGVSFSLPAQYLDTQAILLAPADVPNPVPAVVTDTFASVNAPAPPDDAQTVDGLDGGSFTAAGEIAVPALPEMGSDAALADLSFAQLLQTGPSHATFQVWLSGSAPPSIFDRLRALGVTVRSSRSAVERSALLDEGPLALAYRFVLYSSPVGGLLAIGAGAFGLLATGRRRRTDLRSLTVVGITQRTVVRSIVLESGIVLGVALLVGALAGVAATQQALSSLPEFPHGAGGVPLSDTLPLAQMFAVVVIMAIVLTLTAVTTTFLIFGGSAREPTAVEES